MKEHHRALAATLADAGIRPSFQRICVLGFLTDHRCHPTADRIYRSLRDQIPSLSKMTVYNTLGTLIDAGLVRPIRIDDNETHYDIASRIHGHFRCSRCGDIRDFPVDTALLGGDGLNGFRIDQKDVLFQGVCPECLAGQENGGVDG